MNYFIIDERSEVTGLFSIPDDKEVEGFLKTELSVEIGDVYNEEDGTFSKPQYNRVVIREQMAQIERELNTIDIKLVRCLDEILGGEDVSGDAAKEREKLKAQKVTLRGKRAELKDKLNGGVE